MLAAHPEAAKVSFTGSLATGRRVYQAAAERVVPCSLELGGKSPLIVFGDADLKNAVAGAMMANFYSSGQVCSNGTRVFVHKSIKEEFVAALVARTRKLRLGDPTDPCTDVGPMIHEAHMNRVLAYVEKGKAGGARLLCGGERVTVPGRCAEGFFLSPAIFDECSDDMDIVVEEVFGMLLSVLEFDTEEEVIERANATEYGLAGGVFTKDLARAHRVAGKLDAGNMYINNYNLAPTEVPWGGFKQSGIGRENGTGALDFWTRLKSVHVETGDVECGFPE